MLDAKKQLLEKIESDFKNESFKESFKTLVSEFGMDAAQKILLASYFVN